MEGAQEREPRQVRLQGRTATSEVKTKHGKSKKASKRQYCSVLKVRRGTWESRLLAKLLSTLAPTKQ